MADLTVQTLDLNGLAKTYTPADSSGDTFINTGKEILYVKNDGASDIVVTIDSIAPCSYGFDHDVSITAPAGKEVEIGTFSVARFNNENGRVSISYSDTTSVSVAVVKLG